MSNVKIKITLASTSPRRKEIMSWLGVDFDAVPSHFDESSIRNDDPIKLTQLLAEAKAESIRKDIKEGIIIGSDTVVRFDGRIIEKATDKNHQRELITPQIGKEADVVTSVCLINIATGEKVIKTKISGYVVNNVSAENIEKYIESGEGNDKAGGFGLQDAGGIFMKKVIGCCPNAIGFPICEVAKVLKHFGVDIRGGIKKIVREQTGYEC